MVRVDDSLAANLHHRMFRRRSDPKSVQVERVVNGASLVVRETAIFSWPIRVRLDGIDTPEAQQEFGWSARAVLLIS